MFQKGKSVSRKKEIKHHSSKRDALEENELNELINQCQSVPEKFSKEHFVVLVLAFTGMRADELSHFKPSWIKWQKGVIEIPSEEDGWTPKTIHGARSIPLKDNRLIDILKRWTYEYNFKPIKMKRVTIWRIIQKVASRTKIMKKVYPHSLRATFATTLAFKGFSASSIQHIMGWGSIVMAMEYVKSSGARAKDEFMEKW